MAILMPGPTSKRIILFGLPKVPGDLSCLRHSSLLITAVAELCWSYLHLSSNDGVEFSYVCIYKCVCRVMMFLTFIALTLNKMIELEEIHCPANGFSCPTHGIQEGRGSVTNGCLEHFQDKERFPGSQTSSFGFQSAVSSVGNFD